MERIKCDICGSDKHRLKYKIKIDDKTLRYFRYSRNIPQISKMTGVQNIVECENCNLMFTNPRFSTDELELVYSSEDVIGGSWQNFWYLFNSKLPDSSTSGKKRTSYDSMLYQWKFDIISKYSSPPNGRIKLLDIGCGDGKFVFDASQRGFDAVGIDLSPDRIAKGKELYDLNDAQLKCMNVNEFSSHEKFDVIVMWDVIEHVESPSKLLESIKLISHEQTKVFALTMSLDSITYRLFGQNWNYINPTQHLHYFSHTTMEKLFTKVGMGLVGVEMDNSKNKNLFHLSFRILVGMINQFFFRIYTGNKIAKHLFKPLQGGISDQRMLKRIENLYPGKYLGRYHDNFVFIGEMTKNKNSSNY